MNKKRVNELPLPGCMLPDGADPCEAYKQLYAKAMDMESELKQWRQRLEHVKADAIDEALNHCIAHGSRDTRCADIRAYAEKLRYNADQG